MGMDRHQWGTIHLILGYVLIGLLALHLFLHWNIIKSVYRKLIKRPLLNKLVGLGFIIICFVLVLLPFFINPEIKTNGKSNGKPNIERSHAKR